MSALQRDEEMQTKGIVLVAYKYNERSLSLPEARNVRALQGSLPFKIKAAHYFYKDQRLWPQMVGAALFFLSDSNRLRVRLNRCNPKQAAFILQTFGIPTSDSPLKFSTNTINIDDSDDSSNLEKSKSSTDEEEEEVSWKWTNDQHLEWLAMLQRMEQQELEKNDQPEDSADVGNFQSHDNAPVTIPRRFDVLFGKTKRARQHTGNLRCLVIVEMQVERYEKASKPGKTEIAEEIVSMIHDSGGRFLAWDRRGGYWLPVAKAVARDKVSHFFRSLRSTSSTPSDDADQSPNKG